jgi:hypothetical protein
MIEAVRTLQGHAGNRAVNALVGAGIALSAATRAEFEQRFAADFSGARVHDNAAAHASAAALQANAYTIGWDIVFGVNRFAPHSTLVKGSRKRNVP